ncbi:LysR substrate-binding domain-containing protein [Ramlibacter tataouinensis]|uniref:LysR substrate-binding domain-containing protein n=1 Tax=Ramlibacter tataouinensis TaxID=94132 RepID=UPI0022F391BC|nr:LysR substrate-binding domain-containing protein [Ramlibacter tataouinensis]WBY01881.1 LysR substrate-binding domain-containing protein [Ramlibacter tataouinensis]
MQDLNDMLYFAEVVDQGSFAAAGRKLGLPKSTLSRRIAALEAQLGVRLLHRTTRKLSLTVAGEAYHRHCAALRDEAQAAQDAVAHVRSEPTGTVRVTCPVTVAQTTLAPLLPGFLQAHPRVRIDMQVTNRAVDLVDEGIDVALRVRATLEDSGSLVVKRLGLSRTPLLAAPSLLAREGRPASPEGLAALPTVAMSAVDGRARWQLLGPAGERHELQHQPRCAADDMLTLKLLVLGGIGMGVLPEFMCRQELRTGSLVPVLAGWEPQPGVLHAVFPSRRGMTPAVRAFLDFLGEQVSAEGTDCPE